MLADGETAIQTGATGESSTFPCPATAIAAQFAGLSKYKGKGNKMEVGKELDELIATKVMGWHKGDKNYWYDANEYPTLFIEDRYSGAIGSHPSTAIYSAWEVVDKLSKEWKHFEMVRYPGGRYKANFTGNTVDYGYGDTAPEAICEAALKTLEE